MTEGQRQHDSPLFTTVGLEEWLLYCSVSLKGVVVSIVDGDQSYTGQGSYTFARPREFSFSVSGLGQQIDMTFEPEPTANRMRKLFGTATLVSAFRLGQQTVGECHVKDGYGENDPVIQLRSKSLGVALQVCRSSSSLVYCPLVLRGSDYCEGVFEKYVMMDRARRRFLPKVRHSADFVGSLRKIRFSEEPFAGELPAIAAITAIVGLLVHPEYMKIDVG